MVTWITTLRNKIANVLGPKEHIDWLTWTTIWNSLYLKEKLKTPPWIEFQSGITEQGLLFEKLSFGLGDKNKAVLGKVVLLKTFSAQIQLQLFKQNQEICSVVGSEISRFWHELLKQSYQDIQANIVPNLMAGRLKIANDNQIAEEQKILQWIKTSLHVLKSAITQISSDKKQFITARILLGKLPLQDSLQIVIHCYNLEIVLLSTESKAWKLIVYDHKEKTASEETNQSKPVLNSLVELQLANIWAELDPLIKTIAKI